jgi:hypothetical protein
METSWGATEFDVEAGVLAVSKGALANLQKCAILNSHQY